ncbi:MAG: hypothetical protein E6K74_01925 [Candidatus Eisenbacteria bacterium]|uniref:Uncharacterized protein n=1 Tax=Eiseniibacteriota bacterium TaxID=2212470 RepID=A0A538SWS6_UNCEI|nr:MAG: hypothetical protein E6K74_01925 [Candidatus Eisenbacteria bacterium]
MRCHTLVVAALITFSMFTASNATAGDLRTLELSEAPVIPVVPYDSITPAAARAMSPGRAFLYSFFGTAIPVGVGGATALGNNELSAGSLVAIGGAVVGPSLGHFYAQRYGRAIRGIVIRGVATAIVAGTVTTDTRSDGLAALSAGALLVGITSFVVDIAGAPHSARVHNETVAGRVRLGVAPLAGPPGVAVRVTF